MSAKIATAEEHKIPEYHDEDGDEMVVDDDDVEAKKKVSPKPKPKVAVKPKPVPIPVPASTKNTKKPVEQPKKAKKPVASVSDDEDDEAEHEKVNQEDDDEEEAQEDREQDEDHEEERDEDQDGDDEDDEADGEGEKKRAKKEYKPKPIIQPPKSSMAHSRIARYIRKNVVKETKLSREALAAVGAIMAFFGHKIGNAAIAQAAKTNTKTITDEIICKGIQSDEKLSLIFPSVHGSKLPPAPFIKSPDVVQMEKIQAAFRERRLVLKAKLQELDWMEQQQLAEREVVNIKKQAVTDFKKQTGQKLADAAIKKIEKVKSKIDKEEKEDDEDEPASRKRKPETVLKPVVKKSK